MILPATCIKGPLARLIVSNFFQRRLQFFRCIGVTKINPYIGK